MERQPNVMHNPPRLQAATRMFHPYSVIPINIIIGLLPDSQCLAANERDVAMQPFLICAIMYTGLKLNDMSFGAL